GAGDDDRADAIVGVGTLPGLVELVDRVRGDGVEALGPVQGDRADSVLDVVAAVREGRHCSISISMRPSALSSLTGAWAGASSSRSAAMPSEVVSASRTAATRR